MIITSLLSGFISKGRGLAVIHTCQGFKVSTVSVSAGRIPEARGHSFTGMIRSNTLDQTELSRQRHAHTSRVTKETEGALATSNQGRIIRT